MTPISFQATNFLWSLSDQFLPIAAHELGPCIRTMNAGRKRDKQDGIRVEGSVDFIYENEDMILCHLLLRLGGPLARPDPHLSFTELRDFMSALDVFCTYEHDKARAMIDGTEWYLGDGDDTGAVGFRGDGCFTIWLRHFKGASK